MVLICRLVVCIVSFVIPARPRAMKKATHDKFYVYALFRDDGRVFYIGKGHGDRWNHHAVNARAGKRGYRFHIIRDMQARGVEMPKIKLHVGLTNLVAIEYEIALIKAIGRYPSGPLANLTDGGEGALGYIHLPETLVRMAAAAKNKSPETRAKISAGNRGKVRSAEMRAHASAVKSGKKRSLEHVGKSAAGHRGIKATAEHRAKISAGNLGKTMSVESRAKMSVAKLGKKHSTEARANMSAAKRGKKHSPEHIEKQSAAARATFALRRAAAKEAAD